MFTFFLLIPYAWAIDGDGDGFNETFDCDDADPGVFPGQVDDPATAADEDCDGTSGPAGDLDGDGVPTADETAWIPHDIDGDGHPNWLDPDDDGDNLSALTNGYDGLGDFDVDGIPDWADDDDDGDGVPSIEEWMDTNNDFIIDAYEPDDDSDGLPTLLEDTNGNGNWFDDNWDADALPDFRDPDLPTALDQDGDGIAAPGDCDDEDPLRRPWSAEVCNGVDSDCNGIVDDRSGTIEGWFRDEDGDGYGWELDYVLTEGCPGEGWVQIDGDCDDQDARWNPEAVEICDGIDNDCSWQVDDVLPSVWAYTDADGDGAGDPETGIEVGCLAEDQVDNDDDCNDFDPDTFAGAPEICGNQVDEDCDGTDAICEPACGCQATRIQGTALGILGLALGLLRRRR